MKQAVLSLFIMGAMTAVATAQTKQPAPPPPAPQPTVVQCNQGYKDGMQWTKQQFTEACAKLKAKSQGK